MTETTTPELVDGVSARLVRRPWPAHPIRRDIEVSFECFPPNGAKAATGLAGCIRDLERYDPAFLSITYGAGGSTQTKTLATLALLSESTGLKLAGHLTCVSKTADEVQAVVDAYAAGGIHRIVALRGDAPEGATNGGAVPGGYASAAELVAGIRSRPDGDTFDISVAGYPEVHPRARCAQTDIESLKQKVDAGADRVITQYCFDTGTFIEFFQRARAAGIDVPIVPGIMPVTNFAGIARFSERCGATIPDWMPELLGDLDDTPELQRLVAATVAAEQCRELAEFGINQFHFYTMNKPELTAAVCRILGVKPKATAGTTRSATG